MHKTKDSETAVFQQPATLEAWDRDYYDPIAELYYDRATMLKLMEVEPGAKVLDAGCGPGVHSIRVARAGFRVCAIDVSQNMLLEAQRRVAAAGLASSVEFREEDLTQLRFADASFLYVFSWGVIIHIPEVEKALDEFARIIKPGGKLALYVSNKKSWDQKLESVVRFLLRKPLVGQTSLRLGYGVWYDMFGQKLWLWRFDVAELIDQMESRGFLLTHRMIGEFSEAQRHFKGRLRRILLRLNNLCYHLQLPPGVAAGNLLVFRKSGEIGAFDESHNLTQAISPIHRVSKPQTDRARFPLGMQPCP